MILSHSSRLFDILFHYTAAESALQSNLASESNNTLATTNISKVRLLRPVFLYIYINIYAHTFPGALSLK